MFEVLTPLHIGNGNELTPVDFYPLGDRIIVLDTEKLINDLLRLGVEVEELLDFLRNPPGSLYLWRGYLEKLHLDPRNYARYSLRIRGELGRESSRIKEFIKIKGKPYIPGTSLKGAIRTAVLYKVLKDCGDVPTVVEALGKYGKTTGNIIRAITHPGNQDLLDYYLFYLGRGNVRGKQADDILEAIVFGFEAERRFRYEPKRDPMKALIVRDSRLIPLDNLSVYEVRVVGWGSSIPIWVEALDPGTRFEAEVKVDRELLRIGSDYFNGLLWHCLAGEDFEEFVWKAVEEFYGELAKLDNVKERDVIRLGWGSGWISMTVGILLMRKRGWERVRRKLGLGKNPHTNKIVERFPKTKRLANGQPMGWIKI
ncbi:type III-A CRISPR-associated RAMP protein Csm5 [Pyrococcus horikoshii]|nr:type III-A CRISPR-associated RAMP protein Csm5 [Pyrococcus horikoshii]HII61489.1 type III-A CRISPR-associated RAMP protein Csm5 [Pyrococcus horikoshii]